MISKLRNHTWNIPLNLKKEEARILLNLKNEKY